MIDKQMNKSSIKKHVVFLFLFLTSLFLSSCQSTEPQTAMQNKLERLTYNSEELRLQINNFAIRYTGIIEEAADKIISQTNDPQIKQNALLWKINSIPAISEVIFIIEPFAALLDTWAFCLQMIQFFEEGNGKELFGDHQSIAVTASYKIENEIRVIIKKGIIDEDLSYAESHILPWVKENPIENFGFTRQSTINMTAKYIADRDRTLAASVGSMEQTLNDLSMRLNIYYDQLPKLATWRAEYLANKVMSDEKIDSLNANFDSITKSVERITKVTENGEMIIDKALLKTFQQIDILRLKIREDLQNERDLLLSVFANERSLVLTEINRERLETLEQLEEMSSDLLNQVSIQANDSIDHFFIRLLELLALVYFVGLITVFIYRRRFVKDKL